MQCIVQYWNLATIQTTEKVGHLEFNHTIIDLPSGRLEHNQGVAHVKNDRRIRPGFDKHLPGSRSRSWSRSPHLAVEARRTLADRMPADVQQLRSQQFCKVPSPKHAEDTLCETDPTMTFPDFSLIYSVSSFLLYLYAGACRGKFYEAPRQ